MIGQMITQGGFRPELFFPTENFPPGDRARSPGFEALNEPHAF